MRQLISLLVAVLVCALATPVPVSAEKTEKKEPKASGKESSKSEKSGKKEVKNTLEETLWRVIYQNNGNLQAVFEFHKDGVFVCRGETGTWTLEGATLHIKTKSGADFEGTFDGKTMSGKVHTSKGKRRAEYSWKGTKETPAVP